MLRERWGHIKHYSLTSTCHSVIFPIPPGVVGLVAHVADGSTKSKRHHAARHLPTSEDRPLDAVIVDERRDGPRRLCGDDDDDGGGCFPVCDLTRYTATCDFFGTENEVSTRTKTKSRKPQGRSDKRRSNSSSRLRPNKNCETLVAGDDV